MKLINLLEIPCDNEKAASCNYTDSFPVGIFPSYKAPVCLVDRRSPYPTSFFIEKILQNRMYTPNFFQMLKDFIVKNKAKFYLSFLNINRYRLQSREDSLYTKIKNLLIVHNILNKADELYVLFCMSLRTDRRYMLFGFSKKAKEPLVVVKIALDNKSAECFSGEYAILTFLTNKLPMKNTNICIPQPYFFDRLNNGIVLSGQSFVGGKPMASILNRHNIFTWAESVKNCLIDIESTSLERFLDMQFPHNYFSDINNHIPAALAAEKRRFFDRNNSFFPVGKAVLPKAIMLGDVAPRNIFVADKGLGFIDWEHGMLKGFPFFDIFHFILYSVQFVSRTGFLKGFKEVFINEGPIKNFASRLFRDYSKKMGIATEYINCYLFFYLIRWYSITAIFKREVKLAINLLLEEGQKICF